MRSEIFFYHINCISIKPGKKEISLAVCQLGDSSVGVIQIVYRKVPAGQPNFRIVGIALRIKYPILVEIVIF